MKEDKVTVIALLSLVVILIAMYIAVSIGSKVHFEHLRDIGVACVESGGSWTSNSECIHND